MTAPREIISRAADETVAFGEELGRQASAGWVYGLCGDIGAGKTQLVRGIARGLGSSARVHSPTFALVCEYRDGRMPLFHLDLFRLGSREEIYGAGLEEYFHRPDGLTVVEWPERWFDQLPPTPLSAGTPVRLIRIESIDECTRRITYEDSGV